MPEAEPPSIHITLPPLACAHLEAAVSVLSSSHKRELSGVVAGATSVQLRGLCVGVIAVPVFSAAVLLGAVEAYALRRSSSPALDRLVLEARLCEVTARRVARDWARGDLVQGSLLE